MGSFDHADCQIIDGNQWQLAWQEPMRQRPVTADGVRSFTNDPSWSI